MKRSLIWLVLAGMLVASVAEAGIFSRLRGRARGGCAGSGCSTCR